MKDLVKLIENVKKQVELAMPIIREDVENIINNKVKSENTIERTLDTLLDFANVGCGVEEFKKLNKYYSTINKENSKQYAKFYKDMC